MTAAAEAAAAADVSGALELRGRGFFGLGARWKPVHVYLKGTQLAVCDAEGVAPKPSQLFECSGCELQAVEVPVGFVFKPTGGKQAMTFKCAGEDDQTLWMTALLEAKLTKKSGRSADKTVCVVQ
eukprot:m.262583 g.262583  ORF g.262583 m.262583 type:complete len:125 (-) comp16006_c0_seq6:1039-1413(-)